METRRLEVFRNGVWQECSFEALQPNDVFRFWELMTDNVNGNCVAAWRCCGEPRDGKMPSEPAITLEGRWIRPTSVQNGEL
jgi:hypothetical protein